MTTTTQPDYSNLTIRVTISDGDLLPEGRPTRDAVDRLARQIADAVAAEYPGAEVSVPVQRRTSGGGAISVLEEPEVDADGVHEFRHSDGAIGDAVRDIEGRVWMAWSEALTDADLES